MKIALYIGDHSGDTLAARLGWAVTRLGQKGNFAQVTHVEAIHAEHSDGTVTIASASIREGSLRTGSKNGVRTKSGVRLAEGHWRIIDVPAWSVQASTEWFAEHDGEPYDLRGAFATAWPMQWSQSGRWFCNQAVAARFLDSAGSFGPALFSSVAVSFGHEITNDFFLARRP